MPRSRSVGRKKPTLKQALERTPLKKGTLGRFGYASRLPVKQRRASLMRASRKLGPLTVFRKLNVVATLSRRKQRLSRVFRADANFVRKMLRA